MGCLDRERAQKIGSLDKESAQLKSRYYRVESLWNLTSLLALCLGASLSCVHIHIHIAKALLTRKSHIQKTNSQGLPGNPSPHPWDTTINFQSKTLLSNILRIYFRLHPLDTHYRYSSKSFYSKSNDLPTKKRSGDPTHRQIQKIQTIMYQNHANRKQMNSIFFLKIK